MTYPHVMRLAGPWDCEVLRSDSQHTHSPRGRVHLPADWRAMLGEHFQGRVRCERRFNRPTNLDPHEEVWLVIEGIDSRGRVLLNGNALGEFSGCQRPAEFELTARLLSHNVLTIEIDCAAPAASDRPEGGPKHPPEDILGGVRLEIRGTTGGR